ncbi:hypothetical protein [Salinibacter ruber]|uniref:Uncharacterized protein n=1 Tax=Salinibacter ruber TaxID=146919 RepID=A0AAW5P8H2_9BACT|nr:hypothetical protein [Salinibacter ruber]MCS4157662.1 hypothetical protein [Salinibacter ruber]
MFTVQNTTQASTPGSPSDRRVLNVSGTRLYPTDTMQVEELTSDVLKGIRSGDLRVHRESGAMVTERTLRERGLKIESSTQTSVTSNVDGRVRKKEEVLGLVETAPETSQGEEEAVSEEGATEEAVTEEAATEETDAEDTDIEKSDAEETATEEDESQGASTESAGAENASAEEASEEGGAEQENILATLQEMGAVEDGVETSSDMNAKPLRKLIGEYGSGVWPDGFFENEDRVTVRRALEDAESSD